MSEQVVEVKRERDRCPYCHDEVGDELPRLACNACTAWHHRACWEEAGGSCSACGAKETGTGSARAEAAATPAQVSRGRAPEPTGLAYYIGLPLDLVMAHPLGVACAILAFLALMHLVQWAAKHYYFG